MAALVLVTPPSARLLTVTDLRSHSLIPHAAENDYLDSLIDVTTDWLQRWLDVQFLQATYRLLLDAWPDAYAPALHDPARPGTRGGRDVVVYVPRPPLVSVSSVKYRDDGGVQRTLVAGTDYVVDASSRPGRVAPAYGASWPSARKDLNAVEIEFVAGHATAAAVPAGLRHLAKLLCANWYAHREPVITGTISKEMELSAEALAWPYRNLAA